jgi:4-hydroxy-tetrahydrodipicolinate reductase
MTGRSRDEAGEGGMNEMRLVVVGAAGRMGRMLIKAIHDMPGCQLSGAVEQPGSLAIGQDAGLLAGSGKALVAIGNDAEAAFADADAVLDFTTPAATRGFARIAARHGIAHIVGTTGLAAEDHAVLDEAARQTVVVQAGNMSLGVNLLAALVRRAAQALDASFDIEIVEMHHRMKVDAPSGTALMLGEAAAQGRDIALHDHADRGRDGITGARKAGDIGFASLRGGTVTGEHSVVFAGDGERIVLSHIAEDRGLFARGAVKAALWSRNRQPGRYSMADVLEGGG